METLGRYRILQELGRGAFGVVYSAMDPRIGRKVAIKTIHAGIDQSAGEPFRERLRREAHSAGILSHPNIITIHELDEIDKITYIAMEFVEGRTLAAMMEKKESLPLEFLLTVTRQTADALDFAHSHSIVHRDVKPANIMITVKGNVKVADFGIAKIVDHDASLTKTGMVVGTAHYMSPEQISGGKVGGRSDQFALGVIAYEMLTGQRPFQGSSWPSILHQIMSAEPAPVREYRSDLDDSVTTVLRKALAKKQSERYTSCREFADELSQSVFNTTVERPGIHMMARLQKAPLPQELAAMELLPAAHRIGNVNKSVDKDVEIDATVRAVPSVKPAPNDEATKVMNPGASAVSPAAPPHFTAAPQVATSRGGLRERPTFALVVVATVAAVIVLTGSWIAFRPDSKKPAAEKVVEQPARATAPVVQTEKPAPTPEPFSGPANSSPLDPAAGDQGNRIVNRVPNAVVAPGKTPRLAAENRQPQNLNPGPATTVPPNSGQAELPEATLPLGKYRGPPEGHLAWTGPLEPSARLTITGSRASSGTIDGRGLPAGLAVTALADPSTIQVVEQPSAANQFRLVLRNAGANQAAAISIDWKENRE